MKIIKILALLIASFTEVVAQAPIMDSTWLPFQGSNYYNYTISAPPHSRASDIGANIIWDYNDSIQLHSPHNDSSYYALPATLNISCVNSASNLAKGNAANHHCYIKNSYGLYETGSIKHIVSGGNPDILTINYSKPELLRKSNFRFRDSVIDTSYFSFNYLVDPAPNNYRTTQVKKMKYDGWGTLKFGGLTFDSVVRVHTYTRALDTVYVHGYIYTLNILDICEWYVKWRQVPILTLGTYYSSSNVDPTVRVSNAGFYTIPVGHNSGEAPLPSLTLNYLDFTASFSKGLLNVYGISEDNAQYSLFDVVGRSIVNGNLEYSGNNKWILKTDNLKPGIYLLKINEKDGRQGAIKVVKSSYE